MVSTAVVTGANSGIGLETCRQLLTEGWRVFALDLSTAALTALSEDSGDRLAMLECDVGREESVARASNYINGAMIPVDGGTSAAFVAGGSLTTPAPSQT